MKKVQFILFITLSLFLFACGTSTSLKFETTGYIFTDGSYVKTVGATEVPADGKSYIEIKANLESAEGEVVDGRKVDFTTDYGLFKYKETDSGETNITVKTSASSAVIRLYGTAKQGTANVQVKFDDSNYDGTKIEQSLTLKFGNLSTGDKLSACHFELTCKEKNLGALIDDNIATECFVKTENRKQEPIEVPNIQFKMETGKMITLEGDTPSENRYFYIPDPIKKPKDVDPMTNGSFNDCGECQTSTDLIERCRCDDQGKTLNPRDNLVTIIAYANGEECFEDLNSNGKFDMTEKVYGNFLGEPFVDYNDNAKRDSDEQYVESGTVNGGDPDNYDGENGAWDDDINVWTQTKILLTGAPHEAGKLNTRFESKNGLYIEWSNIEAIPNLTCGGKLEFNFFLYDEYLNPVATNENSSSMTITMSGNDISSLYNKKNTELNFNSNKYGFDMNEKGRIIKFNDKDDEYGSQYTVIVESKATAEDCGDYEGVEKYNVKVEINTTPGVSNEYYPIEGEVITKVKKTWEFAGDIVK